MSLRLVSTRPPMRKKSVCSSSAKSRVSASVCAEQAQQLAERLARDKGLLLAGDAFERLAELFDVREAVAVGRHHRHTLGLQHQQRAVERVAADSSFEMAKMVFETMFFSEATEILHGAGGRELGTCGKLARAMPTIFVLERPARICTQWLSISLMEMSPSGSSLM